MVAAVPALPSSNPLLIGEVISTKMLKFTDYELAISSNPLLIGEVIST